ncbi:hypothetical protein F4776DRAFT_665041 [Hypoxylon sp. NC0597]|nr:hypothetical protein F4776DRAFT_665041 [Hypoxylon sp. NC0597]
MSTHSLRGSPPVLLGGPKFARQIQRDDGWDRWDYPHPGYPEREATTRKYDSYFYGETLDELAESLHFQCWRPDIEDVDPSQDGQTPMVREHQLGMPGGGAAPIALTAAALAALASDSIEIDDDVSSSVAAVYPSAARRNVARRRALRRAEQAAETRLALPGDGQVVRQLRRRRSRAGSLLAFMRILWIDRAFGTCL